MPQPATLAIHGDDDLHTSSAVTSEMSLSTTFRYPTPQDPNHVQLSTPTFDPLTSNHFYSRITNPTMARIEKVVSGLTNGHALCLASGLGAGFVALLHLNPASAVAIRGGYHGCHRTIACFQRIKPNVPLIDLDDEYPEGTLCWLETPVNPYGESRDIQHYADKVHGKNGKLLVDATFAPPPLSDPFQFGADVIMHSGTKYFAGHSDALMGILVVKTEADWRDIWSLRTFTGVVPGALENWLLLRSLRTMELRVTKQAETGTAIAQWLHTVLKETTKRGQPYDGMPAGVLSNVTHASLQGLEDGSFNALKAGQLKAGPACFSISFTDPFYATWFAHTLDYFVPATSLGGVESLVEQRIMSDASANPTLVRLSMGLEDAEDLKDDIRKSCNHIFERKNKA